MRWFILVAAAALLAGCLVVEKKDRFEDTHGGSDTTTDVGADSVEPDVPGPGDDTTPQPDTTPGDTVTPDTPPADVPPNDTPDTPDTHPADVPPEEVTPACPGLGIDSFGVVDGKRYVVFDEEALVGGQYHAAGTPTVTLDVSPASAQPFFTKTGPAQGAFHVDDVPLDFATTEVTFTLTVSNASCFEQRTAKLKVLGNVWVAETSADVVQVFRSNGAFFQQGIGSTFLEDPWELIQVAPDRIGVGNRFKGGVEVFDLEGTHVSAFQTENADGTYLYSVYGAYALMHHRPDGHVWVGGVRGQILDYLVDGTYKKTIWVNDYSTGDLNPKDLLQLPDDTILAIQDTTLDWGFFLFDKAGKYIGDWGDNANELKLEVNRMALNADGTRVAVAGEVGYPTNKGYLALLKLGGQMVKKSQPIAEFYPSYGLVAFGEGFLTVGEVAATNDTPLALFDKDLNLVNAAWHGDKTGSYRGLLVLGGN